jgi:hypothetical protein
MAHDLEPLMIAARLATLRALYVPETVEQARERLARERPPSRESPAQVATRSLAELRALCELARVLHAARPRDPG